MACPDQVVSFIPAKTLFAFGINHKTAPVEIRERLHLNGDEIQQFLNILKHELSECVVLSTCNRTEIYCVSESDEIDIEHFKDLLIDFKGAREYISREDFFSLGSCTSCHQLFNVAGSIDSQVIGDSQILRQLRQAYLVTQESGMAGKTLHQLLQRAFKLGKSTYTETSIHEGAASISLAAVDLAVATLGSLHDKTVIVIGAGEMARATAEALVKKKVGKLIIANRTRARAEKLKAELAGIGSVECEIIELGGLRDALIHADVIVSSTGAEGLILTKDDLSPGHREQLAIDIAVPRDIDPAAAELPNVSLKNIDDLRSILDENSERRALDLPKIRAMVVAEMIDFLLWYYAQPLLPELGKRGSKPTEAEKAEILRVKAFIDDNLDEIHKFAARSGGDFACELETHFLLIEKLKQLKAETFSKVVV